MSTNRKAVKQFILNSIDLEGYNSDAVTDKEKILAAFEIAKNECGHIENQQEMIEYWFSGLCSVISLPYMYNDITRLAVEWGSLPADFTEKQADKICENWFRYMACQFLQMVNAASR